VISNNAPGFKYKYPEAKPTPPGVDDAEWNKIFTAADSRFYNKAHKNANASKVKRGTGETRALALQMLQEKREKAAASAKDTGASTGPATKTKAPAARKSQPAKKEASTSSREMSPTTMDMAERIKTEGRARKAPSVAASSDRGTPAPSTAPKMGSAPPAPPKPQKPGPKKGPGPMKKKQDKKALSKGNIDRSRLVFCTIY
jgi:COMPASS component SPP1